MTLTFSLPLSSSYRVWVFDAQRVLWSRKTDSMQPQLQFVLFRMRLIAFQMQFHVRVVCNWEFYKPIANQMRSRATLSLSTLFFHSIFTFIRPLCQKCISSACCSHKIDTYSMSIRKRWINFVPTLDGSVCNICTGVMDDRSVLR